MTLKTQSTPFWSTSVRLGFWVALGVALAVGFVHGLNSPR